MCPSTKFKGVVVKEGQSKFSVTTTKILACSYQMSVVTEAHSRTFAKWKICVVRSTVFVFLCEAVWIEIFRFWEVRCIKMET